MHYLLFLILSIPVFATLGVAQAHLNPSGVGGASSLAGSGKEFAAPYRSGETSFSQEGILQLETRAAAAMLMNADTGAILYEKQGESPIYPASTTKIATALFVLEEKAFPLNQLMKVSAESLRMRPAGKFNAELPPYWWDVDGTRMWLHPEEQLPLEALLHGLMMVSGNDAANVIAEGVSGSVPVFVEEMNRYLKGIGCLHTQFVNPHGCHHPEHVSSVYDLCLMTKRALQIPQFREIVSKSSYKKPKTNKQGAAEIQSFNQLLKIGGKFHYPKAIGVKTGFHSSAQNALVAAASHEGRTLIAAFAGTAKREHQYQDAIRFFEAAFAEMKETRILFGTRHLFGQEIPGAKGSLKASLQGDLSISYYPSEEPACRAFIHWKIPPLPIAKGAVVGEVRIIDQHGTLLQKGDLFAKEEVKGTFFYSLKKTLGFL